MKRITVIAIVLSFTVGAVLTPAASAGWFNKKKPERTEMPESMKKGRRPKNGALVTFTSGVLQQEGFRGWKVGETKLEFAKDCLILTEGSSTGSLVAGRNAVVMGQKIGDTIYAWNVRVSKSLVSTVQGNKNNLDLVPSLSNPNVGEVIDPPM